MNESLALDILSPFSLFGSAPATCKHRQRNLFLVCKNSINPLNWLCSQSKAIKLHRKHSIEAKLQRQKKSEVEISSYYAHAINCLWHSRPMQFKAYVIQGLCHENLKLSKANAIQGLCQSRPMPFKAYTV